VTADVDLFKQITHAVLDLQNAQLQFYPRPLKALARLSDILILPLPTPY
jgi:hypothetical protein